MPIIYDYNHKVKPVQHLVHEVLAMADFKIKKGLYRE